MTTTPDLATFFDRHERAVLAFSGGKDSLVCLHLCRDNRDKLTVVWVNTGAAFPHMAEFVHQATEGFNLVELESDQAVWIEQQGLPSDMVPVSHSVWRLAGDQRQEPMIQPWTSCCAKLRFQPILDYLTRSDATLFIHGQRHSDGGGFSADSQPGARVEICKPIWGWSDHDILAYIGEHEIELSEQYSHGVIDSLECWNCTARAGDSADGVRTRLHYMARQYPDLFEKLKLSMGKVYLATEMAFAALKGDVEYAWREVTAKAETDRGSPWLDPGRAPEPGGSASDLEREIRAYKAMEVDLCRHHAGKWVVIHGGKLVDAFDTLDAAAREAVRRFGRGPYLIRKVGIAPLLFPADVGALQGGRQICS